MSGKFFLDTNVFVYEFDTREPEKSALAADLVRKAIATRSGVVSYQVVQEFFSVAFTRFLVRFPDRCCCAGGGLRDFIFRRFSSGQELGWDQDQKSIRELMSHQLSYF